MLKNHTNIWQKDRLGHGEASQKKNCPCSHIAARINEFYTFGWDC